MSDDNTDALRAVIDKASDALITAQECIGFLTNIGRSGPVVVQGRVAATYAAIDTALHAIEDLNKGTDPFAGPQVGEVWEFEGTSLFGRIVETSETAPAYEAIDVLRGERFGWSFGSAGMVTPVECRATAEEWKRQGVRAIPRDNEVWELSDGTTVRFGICKPNDPRLPSLVRRVSPAPTPANGG